MFSTPSFPKKSSPRTKLLGEVWYQWKNLLTFKRRKSIAYLLVYPNWTSVLIQVFFAVFNPNNLGNWSVEEKSKLSGTRKIEHELIKSMNDLYGVSNLPGYVTSGGTEGNIFLAWTGRKYAESRGVPLSQICLIGTSLSHYSVVKASDVVGLTYKVAPLNEETYSMDAKSLEDLITSLMPQYKAFLICLTNGYTLTGTSDDIFQINDVLTSLQKKHHLQFYAWVDASLNGLINPFINKWRPFQASLVKGLVVDFHKFFGCHYPSGLVLYKSELNKFVTKKIDYLEEKDLTLLGSRPGIPALSSWVYIHYFGAEKIKKRIMVLMKKKEKWLSYFSSLKGVKLIHDLDSLQAGLVIHNQQTAKYLKDTFDILIKSVTLVTTHGKVTKKMAKVFFLDEKIPAHNKE